MRYVINKMTILRVALGTGLVTFFFGGAVDAANFSPRATQSTAHAANIQFKSQANSFFCIEPWMLWRSCRTSA